MNKDKGMVLRMLEYDIHNGLVHDTGNYEKQICTDTKHELIMPRSVILYLNDTNYMPAKETCLIRFADGTTYEYQINMLIPFLPIRFRKYFNRKRNGVKQPITEAVRKDLTDFIRECIMIIYREKENVILTDAAGKEIIELLDITCGYLLKSERELKKEVHGIMRPIVMLQSERYENAIRKLIEKCCFSGQCRQEVKESIQDIFSLDEAEAEEKIEKYW